MDEVSGPLAYAGTDTPLPEVAWKLDPKIAAQDAAEYAKLQDDWALIEQAGEQPTLYPLGLTDAEREALRRKIAAKRDTAMLGDSGYARIEADFYPTPPENVDCLLEHFTPHMLVWEPACGRGDISKRLLDFGHHVVSTDLHDQGFGDAGHDFLAATAPPPGVRSIITNPPYADGLAEKFARHAIALMQPVRGQVAMFLRNEFDCGKARMDLFGLPPFHKKVVVTKRPRWIEGSTGSPRHNYAWFIWDWRHKAGSAAVAYSHPDYAPAPHSGPALDRATKH